MKKVVHVIAILGTILFAIGSINWIAAFFHLFGNRIFEDEMGIAIANFVLFFVFLILANATKTKAKKKK